MVLRNEYSGRSRVLSLYKRSYYNSYFIFSYALRNKCFRRNFFRKYDSVITLGGMSLVPGQPPQGVPLRRNIKKQVVQPTTKARTAELVQKTSDVKTQKLETSGGSSLGGGGGKNGKSKKSVAENPENSDPDSNWPKLNQANGLFSNKLAAHTVRIVSAFAAYGALSLAYNGNRYGRFCYLANGLDNYTSRFLQFQNLLNSPGKLNLADLQICLNYFSQNLHTLERDVYRYKNPNFGERCVQFIFVFGKNKETFPEHPRLTLGLLETLDERLKEMQKEPGLMEKTCTKVASTGRWIVYRVNQSEYVVRAVDQTWQRVSQTFQVARNFSQGNFDLKPYQKAFHDDNERVKGLAGIKGVVDSCKSQMNDANESTSQQNVMVAGIREDMDSLLKQFKLKLPSGEPSRKPRVRSSSIPKGQEGKPKAIMAVISFLGRQALVSPSIETFVLRVIFFLFSFFAWNKFLDFLKSLFFDLLPPKAQQRFTELNQRIEKVLTIFYKWLLMLVTYPIFYVLLVVVFLLSYPLEWLIFVLATLSYLFGLNLFVVNKRIQSLRVSSFFDICWDKNLRLKIKGSSNRNTIEQIVCARIDGWRNNLAILSHRAIFFVVNTPIAQYGVVIYFAVIEFGQKSLSSLLKKDNTNKDPFSQNSLALFVCPPVAILSVVSDYLSTSKENPLPVPVLCNISKNNATVRAIKNTPKIVAQAIGRTLFNVLCTLCPSPMDIN